MLQPIPHDWEPTDATYQYLAQVGISREFALAQVLEFRIYWSERGLRHHGWSAKFLKHCMYEFRRHEIMVARGENTCAMSIDWRPIQKTFEVLTQGGIPKEFAESVLPEFIIYWCDRGDISNTWNTKFIGHVRYKWQTRSQLVVVGKPTREHTLIGDLTSRDWAAEYIVGGKNGKN